LAQFFVEVRSFSRHNYLKLFRDVFANLLIILRLSF
jgi:hypothetical protein